MWNFIDRLSLSTKLRLAPGLVMILMVLLGITVWVSLSAQSRQLTEVTVARQARSDAAARLSEAFRLGHSEVYQLLSWIGAEFSTKRTAPLEKQLRARMTGLGEQADALLQEQGLLTEEAVAIEATAKAIKGYEKWADDILKLAAADMSLATQLTTKLDLAFAEAAKNLDGLRDIERKLMIEDNVQTLAATARLQWTIAALVAASWILSLVVSSLLRRRMSAALSHLRDGSLRLAQGDLSRNTPVLGTDEIAQIGRAMNTSFAQLGGLFSDIQDSSRAVYERSTEVAQRSRQLSSQIESQAAALEQTSASVHGMTEALGHTAVQVRSVDDMARSAKQSVQSGAASTLEVRKTMESIKASANRIADITGVVDGIAFQTNILALNAAVEAARAGEQGRGFAVVAAEVRTLAQRSAVAAKEIKALIAESTDRIAQGATLVGTAERSMDETSRQVTALGDVLSGISATVAEQAGSITEINAAVANIDQASQMNSAEVEKSAAAAAMLLEHAEQLNASTAMFTLPRD